MSLSDIIITLTDCDVTGTASPVIKTEAGENKYSPNPLPHDRAFEASQFYSQHQVQPMAQDQADTLVPRTHPARGESSLYFGATRETVALCEACD